MNFLMIGLVVLSITFGPLITIWALNLLFGLSIPFSFGTWFACLWLCIQLRGGGK